MVVILERIIEGKLHSVGIKVVEAGMLEVVVFYEYTCKVGTYFIATVFYVDTTSASSSRSIQNLS